MTKTVKDWRGTPINIGDTVVYGSGVGRSIQLNEAIVDGFHEQKINSWADETETKVKVRIIRRSYMQGTKPVVTVGADRITVVTTLPPCTLQTQGEKVAKDAERTRIREAAHASHDFPPMREEKRTEMRQRYGGRTTLREYSWTERVYPPCTRCGVEYWTGYNASCVPGHNGVESAEE